MPLESALIQVLQEFRVWWENRQDKGLWGCGLQVSRRKVDEIWRHEEGLEGQEDSASKFSLISIITTVLWSLISGIR